MDGLLEKAAKRCCGRLVDDVVGDGAVSCCGALEDDRFHTFCFVLEGGADLNDEELAIDTHSQAARRNYHDAFETRAHDLDLFCQRYGIHLMSLSTDDDPVSALQTALGRRTH